MPAFAETILVVFTLIALGYGAASVRLLKPETGDGLSDFVFTIAVPLLLFRTIATASFDHGAPWALWATYFTAVLVTWTSAHLIIRGGFGRDARSGVVAGVTAGFSNLVLLGVPFTSGLFGEPGLAVLSQLVSIHLPIMLGASIILFEWAVKRDGAGTQTRSAVALITGFVRQLVTNPLDHRHFYSGPGRTAFGLVLPRSSVDRVIPTVYAGGAGPLALFPWAYRSAATGF